ncbi:hypothetical protein QBD12_15040 [Lacticaseibacillus paracasei subsp. paracasei]|nr:hypothetical protein [Lacticaseibacillus paracasei]MDH7451359.1 hypothetical protein [Lacticaseibacillus paracasei subsp. paracasei]
MTKESSIKSALTKSNINRTLLWFTPVKTLRTKDLQRLATNFILSQNPELQKVH